MHVSPQRRSVRLRSCFTPASRMVDVLGLWLEDDRVSRPIMRRPPSPTAICPMARLGRRRCPLGVGGARDREVDPSCGNPASAYSGFQLRIAGAASALVIATS